MIIKKIVFLMLLIGAFSCKNASENVQTANPEIEKKESSADEGMETEGISSETVSDWDGSTEQKLTVDASLLFPFDMDLSTFEKDPEKIGLTQGDCSGTFQRYTKNEIEISTDSFDCDVYGFNTYSFLFKNGELVSANHKSGENLSTSETDFAARVLTEKVYDFSVTPNVKYIRSDTIQDFETTIIQSGFTKTPFENSQEVYAQLVAKYAENQETIWEHDGPLVLTEDNLGSLPLSGETNLNVYKLREAFEGHDVSDRKDGESSDSYYYYYKIGEDISLSTANTENENLSQVRIEGNSTVPDVYGIQVGMSYHELIDKRPKMTLTTQHYHVYLIDEGSNIKYELSLGEYQGPDKDNYTIDDIPGTKVIAIIWE
ncbi:MAG: hypothetical protein ABJM06_09840 [Gilvibacter sp.]